VAAESIPMAVPHCPQAERAVLGALILDNRVFDDVSDILRPEHFHDTKHQRIFEAIRQQAHAGKPFDAITLADRLGGELQFLGKLVQETPSASNAPVYAELVREAATRRRVMAACDALRARAISADGSAAELLDEATRSLLEIGSETTNGPVPIQQCLTAAVDRIDRLSQQDDPITGIATGFADLDKLTAGLQPSDLIILAGRPSMGKTALAMNFAEHAAMVSKVPVLVFSLEQPQEQLTARLLSSVGHINQQKIRTGKLQDDDWPKLTQAASLLDSAQIFIDDSAALSVHQIRARSRRMLRQHDIKLVIVDYLQLCRGDNPQNRTQEVSVISGGLKALAKELRVPVVALSQLSRAPAGRGNARPIMSDLRDSGSIEQDADVILFIYRDEVYHDDSPHKGIAEILLAKHRNGPIGKFYLTFLGQFCRFENHIGEVMQELPPMAKKYRGGFDYQSEKES
jgi:replicative DNA helicase